MLIKAVIFDCFGVLYTDGKSQIIEACPDEHRQAMDDLFMQADYGYITGEEFSEAAAALIGISRLRLSQLVDGMYHRNELLLRKIADYRKDHKVGLLSNVSKDMMYTLFTQDELMSLFDAVVLSSDVGMVKPSADIYLLTAARLGVKPEDCVMIDDMEKNTAGAREVGMQAIHYQGTPQLVDELERLLHA